MKAIFVPSGDQLGQVSWTADVNVSRILLPPSASIAQMSQFENGKSSMQRVYAIRVPTAL